MKSLACMTTACFAFLIASGNSALALEAFLKVSTIDGESTRAGFENYSDILSYNIGIQGASWCSSASCANPRTFTPMTIQKYLDKASPRFFGGVLTGTRYATAQIDIRRGSAGTSSPKLALWEFQDAVFSSYSTGGNGQAAIEALSIDFRRITYTYWPLLAGGTNGTPVSFTWDRQSGTSTGSGSFTDLEFVTNFTATVAPEPSAFALLVSGAALSALSRRRNRHR
jgi:type VI protein secretion system component Hcp